MSLLRMVPPRPGPRTELCSIHITSTGAAQPWKPAMTLPLHSFSADVNTREDVGHQLLGQESNFYALRDTRLHDPTL